MKNLLFLVLIYSLTALPINPIVNEGNVEFHTRSDLRLLELETGAFADLSWEDFSVQANETISFIQKDENSLAVNRVISTNPSNIFGRLKANGQVLLLNPNGVLVGREAYLDVNTFIASTLDLISRQNGEMHFAGGSENSIVNEGTIHASHNLVLISSNVKNEGTLISDDGSILIGSGKEVLYQPNKQERLFIRFKDKVHVGTGIENTGKIQAIHSELKADGNLYAYAIQHSGTIDALEVEEINGEIFLVAEEGLTEVTGGLNANEVRVLGKRVSLNEQAKLSGTTILIGGDTQGKNPDIINSEYTYVGKNVEINADGKGFDHGGKVIVWGDDLCAMYGSIYARSEHGNGGFVEISSPKALFAKGPVDTSSTFGKKGTLLLDPCAVTISTAATTVGVTPTSPPPACPLPAQNYNFTDGFGGLTAANILNTDINGYLACNDVTIDASSSGTGGVGSITLADGAGGGLTWATSSKLTLIADAFISIRNSIIPTSIGLGATTTVVELNAPIVSFDVAAELPVIRTGSGQVVVNAPTSLSFFSSTSTILGKGGIQSGTGGPGYVDILTGNLLISATTNGITIEGSVGVEVDAAGSVQIIGGTATIPDTSEANILTASGPLRVYCGGNCTLLGGMGDSFANAVIVANGPGASLDVRVGGDLFLQAGTTTGGSGDGSAGIALQTGPGSFYNVSARNITLISGAGTGTNVAALGAIVGGSAPVTITSTGPNGISLNANGSNPAIIGTPAIFGGSGNVTINTTHFTATASTTAGAMSLGGLGASVVASGGDLFLTATGNITLNGGGGVSDNPSRIAATSLGRSVNVTANNISLFGGSAPTSHAVIESEMGPANVMIAGDFLFQAGSAIGCSAGVGVGNLGGAGDLTISGRDYTFIGGSGPFCSAGVSVGTTLLMAGGGDGSIFLTSSGNIQMTGGSGATSYALIATAGTLGTNAVTIIGTNPLGNLTMMSGSGAEAAIFTIGGPISVMMGENISMVSTPGFDAFVSVGSMGSGDLFMQAGNNMTVNSTIENLGPGDIILVVDADFPQPFIGLGSFTLGPTSTLSTNGGAIRVFTARQFLNSISGLLNTSSFSGGTLFEDTATEVWCTYFPSSIGGFPYTIFYKPCEELLLNQASFSIDEALNNLHAFNEFPGWWMRYTLSSDISEVEYDQLFFMRRRFSPQFWQPKSYTVWLHDLMDAD